MTLPLAPAVKIGGFRHEGTKTRRKREDFSLVCCTFGVKKNAQPAKLLADPSRSSRLRAELGARFTTKARRHEQPPVFGGWAAARFISGFVQ